MPEQETQAVEESVSSESGTDAELQQPAPEQTGDTETKTVSSEPGTDAGSTEPEVDWRARYEEQVRLNQKQNAGYDQLKSDFQATQSQLQGFRAAEQERLEAAMKDKERWYEIQEDPTKWREFVGTYLNNMVEQQLMTRDQAMTARQEQIESMEAANRLRDFAINEAGMSDAEYQAFLHEHSVSGVPFAGYPPTQAESIAKALIRDKRHDRFAAQQQKIANQQADKKAQRAIAGQVPEGAPPESGGDLTPQEAYRQAVSGFGGENDPNSWV